MNAPATYRPAGSLDASAALQPYAGPWNARLAAHLARRAGFGAAPDAEARLATLSMNAAVDGFVHFPSTAALAAPPDLGAPQDLITAAFPGLAGGGRMGGMRMRGMTAMDAAGMTAPAAGAAATAAGPSSELRQARQALRKDLRQRSIALQEWWLERMIATPAPLQEKMTLFWHGHFTSTVIQKGVSPQEIADQNELFRRYALGNVRDLTLAVAKDPAMLKYLDNRTNVKAHPNENFARELMELFTLGIGNYTEQDVRESARAFTGWTTRGGYLGTGFRVNEAQHDDGQKTILGSTGAFDGGDVVALIFKQPASAKWFSKKLLSYFVYSDPEPELVDAFAATIRKNDFALSPAVSTLLRSNVFYSERAYRALVKSPAEFVVGAYRLFGLSTVQRRDQLAMSRMGQILFYPPNVKGWDGGSAWLSSSTVLARENFASGLMGSPEMTQARSWLTASLPPSAAAGATMLVDRIVQGDASGSATARIVAYLDGTGTSALGALSGENYEERMRGAAYLTMAMPAYQLA